MPALDFDEIAQRIIRMQLSDFALAYSLGDDARLADARDRLKKAIVDALEAAAKEGQCQNAA